MTDDEIFEDYKAFRRCRHYLRVSSKQWAGMTDGMKKAAMKLADIREYESVDEAGRKWIDAAKLAKKYGKTWERMGLGKPTFNGRRCWHEDIEPVSGGFQCRKCRKLFRDTSNSELNRSGGTTVPR